MQKSKTQVKHDNLVAQIDVLKKDLRDVNTDLTNKIKERDSLNNELLSVGDKLDKINKEWNKLDLQSKMRMKELDNKTLSLQERTENINQKELASIKRMEVDKKSFNAQMQLYSNAILDLRGKIELKKRDVLIEQDNIKYYTDLSQGLRTEVKVLSQEKTILDKDIQKLNIQVIEKLSDLNSQTERMEKKLKTIEDKIFEEQQKTELPAQNIEIMSKQLDRKKKNLDTIIRRFNKQFKEKFPLQDLKL